MKLIQTTLCAGIAMLTLLGCAAPDADDGAFEETAADEADQAESARTSQALQSIPVVNGGTPPHNKAFDVLAPNGCLFRHQHGNYLAAAYAKLQIITPGCQGRVSVTASQNGQLAGNTTDLFGVEGGLRTAQVDWANIIGSDVTITNINRNWSQVRVSFKGF